MKILMLSTHLMKYIWYSPQKSKYPLFTGSFEKLKGWIFYAENVGALYLQQLHLQIILILMFYLKG